VEALERTSAAQHLEIQRLHRNQAELFGHSEALRDCLRLRGIVAAECLPAQLHRQRFEEACRQHTFAVELNLVAALLERPVLEALVRSAGATAVDALVVAATGFRRAFARARPLAALLPQRILVASGRGVDGVLRSAELYEPRTDAWHALPALHAARSGAGAGTLGGQVCVVGGDGEGGGRCANLLASTEGLQFAGPRAGWAWEELPALPMARFGCAVAVAGGYVYALGGDDGRQPLDSVQRLRLGSAAWEFVPPMPTQRSRCGAAALGGAIYVVGGYTHGRALSTVECLDPRIGCWRSLALMPTRRYACALVACLGRVFALGGHDGERALRKAEAYDPGTNSWEALPPMRSARAYCVASALEWGPLSHCIYVVGGQDHAGPLRTGERLKFLGGRMAIGWQDIAPAGVARSSGVAAVVRIFESFNPKQSLKLEDVVL